MRNKNKFPISDHCDGERFFNPGINTDKSLTDFLKWRFKETRPVWPTWVENKFKPQLPEQINKNEVYVTFINHVTYLFQTNSHNILFDPVFSERTSPVQFAGVRRVRRPGIEIHDLPKIDIVLVSHNHYDHMDLASLLYLQKKHQPLFIMPLGNAVYLKAFSKNLNVIELDWWQEHILEGVKLTLTPALHWSARGFRDRRKALWGGFIVENQNSNKIYFAGDTGFSKKIFSEIKNKAGELEMAFLPIGAYAPRWFMKLVHMNPDEAVMAHQILQPKVSIGMHYGTFRLTDEPWDQPLLDLNSAMKNRNISNFETLYEGQTKKIIFN